MKIMENQEFKVEKYPDWCKDDIDKIIHNVLINAKKELTFTQLKNKVYEFLFQQGSKESLMQRLTRLEKEGIVIRKKKEVDLEVWKGTTLVKEKQ